MASDWRKIETALIDLLTKHGFHVYEYRGDRWVKINGQEISLEEVARDLAERIE